MSLSIYLLPLAVLLTFVIGFFKKVDLYTAFISGVNDAIRLLFDIFPYLCAVLIMNELCLKSGFWQLIEKALFPLFKLLKIPSELAPLIIIKPLSGSGALATLGEIFNTYGADSYISRCACCIFSSSETVFYVSAVYLSGIKNKKLGGVIFACITSSFLSCILACIICNFI